MNLFSRLDALLDGTCERQNLTWCGSRREAERLFLKMAATFDRAQQAAVRIIAVERSACRELKHQRQRAPANRVILKQLVDEHARALASKQAVLKSLQELREGLVHARLLRDEIRRRTDLKVEAIWDRRWRQFWRAYHWLCDLADTQTDKRPEPSNTSL